MPVWEPEVEIGEELVRALLAEQFPELDAGSARFLGEGWDNSVWLVEEQWAFRFPRRAVAAPLVEREVGVLPRLGPLLPVPVPVPAFVGTPSGSYPWSFFGCELLPGREVAEARPSEGELVRLGAELGRFLRALHDASARAAADPEGALPVDPNGRGDMSLRAPRARQQLAELERLGVWRSPAAVARLLRAAEELPVPPGPDVLLHGDLHVRHVLVAGGRLSGVIDWGDVCVGDPSIDLHLARSLLPPEGRDALIREYGDVDEERGLRARVLAISLSAMLALYAHDVGHASLLRESLAGLERTLVD